MVGSKIIKRKRVHRAYKRKLVRDHELEETFYKVGISFVVQRHYTASVKVGIEMVLSKTIHSSLVKIRAFLIAYFNRILHFPVGSIV